MTVQALVETFPWVDIDVHVPLVFFKIVGLKVFMDARWLVTP